MLVWLMLACGVPQRETVADTPVTTPIPTAVAPPVAPSVEGVPEPGVAPTNPAATETPAIAYTKLRSRVEEPERAGECKSDAECAPAGCSREVCTTVAAGPEIMSTCEVLPLFSTLDACGCHDSACTWTLKSGGPKLQPIPLPGDAPQ